MAKKAWIEIELLGERASVLVWHLHYYLNIFKAVHDLCGRSKQCVRSNHDKTN